jgi:short-subunit dehydrogenase
LVNICSVASIEAYPASGSYTVSKFAMMGLNKALRQELKPHGIKVTAVLPGAVLTSAWDGVAVQANEMIASTDIADLLWACHTLSPGAVVEEMLIRPM